MEKALNGDISDIERSQMHFALGKAYEVMKDFDKSFKNYYAVSYTHLTLPTIRRV